MEVAIVLIVVLLVFGARRVPDVGRSLGTGLREFKQGIAQVREPVDLAKKSLEPEEGVQGPDGNRV